MEKSGASQPKNWMLSSILTELTPNKNTLLQNALFADKAFLR